MVIKGYAWFKEQWGVLTFKDSLFSNVLYEWVFLDHKSHKTIRQAQLQGFRIKIELHRLFSQMSKCHMIDLEAGRQGIYQWLPERFFVQTRELWKSDHNFEQESYARFDP